MFLLLHRCHLTVKRLRTLGQDTQFCGCRGKSLLVRAWMEPRRSEQQFIAIVGLLSPIQCLPALGFLTQEPAISPSCDTVTLRRYFSRTFLQRCPEEAAQGCWTPPHPLPPVSRMQILHKGGKKLLWRILWSWSL